MRTYIIRTLKITSKFHQANKYGLIPNEDFGIITDTVVNGR